jgi:hypothetical protein
MEAGVIPARSRHCKVRPIPETTSLGRMIPRGCQTITTSPWELIRVDWSPSSGAPDCGFWSQLGRNRVA